VFTRYIHFKMLKAACLLLICVCAQAAIDKENFTTKKKYNGPHGNGFIQPKGEIQEHSNMNQRHRRESMPDRVIRVVTCLREPEKITLKPGDEIIFKSPGYPSSYPPISNCGWKFKARPGSGNIKVTCTEFSLQPPSEGQCPDWLALGKERFCGSSGPSSVTLGKKVKVTFRSNRKNNFPGFTCTASLDPEHSGNCVCGVVNLVTRIVGGVETEVNEYPWQVALVSKGGSSVNCGGTLINDRWVLTAAHCTNPSQVLLGNHLTTETDDAEIRVDVKRVIEHPKWGFTIGSIVNDFMLVELATPLNLETVGPNAIRPVCLPSSSNPAQYEGVPAIVSGWGATSSGGFLSTTLQKVKVNTMSNAECNEDYNGNITSSMICASKPGKDSCQGDSGGPMVRNMGLYFNLIGVVSWGYGCADPDFPGVYSRVTNKIDWITSKSSSGQTCPPPS
ncbi:unnamed protein product, partial [Meganyctiphanes norvegica]